MSLFPIFLLIGLLFPSTDIDTRLEETNRCEIGLAVYGLEAESITFRMEQNHYDRPIIKDSDLVTPFKVKFSCKEKLSTFVLRSEHELRVLIKQDGQERVQARGKNIFVVVNRPSKKKKDRIRFYTYSFN